jgi:predicted ATPase
LIGTRGQYAAAALEQNKNELVATVNPVTGMEVTESLAAALAHWLKYFELAEGIRTKEFGKLGVELTVITSGSSRYVDLTNVGVGVSQVLPILVLGLLSPAKGTLVFEQPELHLHPRLQALLADFFLSLIKVGKQCIVETHSEHFINRLLLRIAEREDSIEDDLKIYFATKKQGETEFETIEADKYGSIGNWPEGFFDQTFIDSSDLIRASAKKQEKARHHKL